MNHPLRENPQFIAAVVFAVLLLAALAAASIWWLVAVAVLGGLFFAVRALAPGVRIQLGAAAQRRVEVGRRADQQNRWTLRGDARGVYGPAGAKLMRSLTPDPRPDVTLPDTGENPNVAAIAYTAADLDALLTERLPAWHWAAFGSVLVQRRAAVQSRLRDQQLCYAPPSGVRADTDQETARLALEWADELCVLVDRVQEVMLSKGFQGIFDDSCTEETADADTILHTAHRLMDLHDRFLALSESCRGVAAPASCTNLLSDCAHLIDIPLEGYRTFIDDFVTRMAEIPEVLRWARGPVELDPILLDLEGDYDLMHRFFERLREAGAS